MGAATSVVDQEILLPHAVIIQLEPKSASFFERFAKLDVNNPRIPAEVLPCIGSVMRFIEARKMTFIGPYWASMTAVLGTIPLIAGFQYYVLINVLSGETTSESPLFIAMFAVGYFLS